MKKGSIVLATTENGYMFLTEILKTLTDEEAAIVSCYSHESEVEVIPTSVKLALGVTEDWNTTVLPLENLEELVTADRAKELKIGEYGITLAMPGYSVDFKKREHLDMFQEYVDKYQPAFSFHMMTDTKACYPHDWMKVKPSMLDMRMLATRFKNAINLSYVPFIEEEKLDVVCPEICVVNVEWVKYLKK